MACSYAPLIGFFRDGCCHTDENDHGTHVVCVRATDDFLAGVAPPVHLEATHAKALEIVSLDQLKLHALR